MLQKNLIRSKIRKNIKDLTVTERQNASQQITKLILNKLPSDSIHIAVYWPTKYEINSIPLIEFLLINHKSCYLPVINQHTQTLNFIKYTANTKLIKNKFGILEPAFNAKDQILVSQLDLIFMPLVAFDSFGHRIGSGSGFYDRSIETKSNLNGKLIGLAYSIQQVANFIPDAHDVNLDFVVTEQKWLDFS